MALTNAAKQKTYRERKRRLDVNYLKKKATEVAYIELRELNYPKQSFGKFDNIKGEKTLNIEIKMCTH